MGWIVILSKYAGPAVAGALLVRFGRRARRISDHPFCRKCGYDLFGRSEESTRCAECGADLQKRRAIVEGKYQRRPLITVLGVLFILASLVLTGKQFGYPLFFGSPEEKLAWVLIFEPSKPGSVLGMRELLQRNQNGALSGWQRYHAARKMIWWSGGWSTLRFYANGISLTPAELIEQSKVESWLSDADYVEYMKQGVTPHIVFRRTVKLGDPLAFRLDSVSIEGDIGFPIYFKPERERRAAGVIRKIVIDGIECELPEEFAIAGDPTSARIDRSVPIPKGVVVKPTTTVSPTTRAAMVGQVTQALSPAVASAQMVGTNRVTVTLDVTVDEVAFERGSIPKTIARFDIDVSGQFALVAENTPTIQLLDSTQGFAPVEIGRPRLWRNDWERPRVGSGPASNVWMTLSQGLGLSALYGRGRGSSLPTTVAGRVMVRVGESEFGGGTILIRGMNPVPRFFFPIGSIPSQAEVCDVVILPDPKVAAATVDVDRIWNEPIEIKNVPVGTLDGYLRVSRAAERGFWTRGRALIVGIVAESSFDVRENVSTGKIRPIALLAGDMNIGARPILTVKRDGRLPDPGAFSLMVIEPAESGFDASVSASDFGFLQSVDRRSDAPRGAPTAGGQIDPIYAATLSDPLLKDHLRIVQSMRLLSDPDRPATQPFVDPRINALASGVAKNISIDQPIRKWEGEGRPVVVLASIHQVERTSTGAIRTVMLHPLFTLAGRFDVSLIPKLPVAMVRQDSGKSQSEAIRDGAIVLAVVRIHDADRSSVHGAIIDESVPFMPRNAAIIELSGENDSRIEQVIEATRKIP